MAKITRYGGNLKAFAADALGTERTLFGELVQGDTLDENINLKFLRGWGIVGSAEFPTLEDFNAMGYTLGQLIAYLHQVGVPEWHTAQEYHQYSIAQVNGVIYISLTNNNTGNDPTIDAVNWRKIRAEDVQYDNAVSGLVATNIKAAIDENAAGIAEFRLNWIRASQIGTGLSLAGIVGFAITALSSTEIAFIDETSDELRTYQWDGAAWTLVGAGLSLTTVTSASITRMTASDIAFIDIASDELRWYHWNGAAWALVGTPLAIAGGIAFPGIVAINNTDVAYVDSTNDELRLYRWDTGTGTWAMIGTGLSIPGIGQVGMAALNETDIAVIDNALDTLRTYRWDTGTNTWSLVGAALSIPGLTSVTITALNVTDVAFCDNSIQFFRVYRWDGAAWSVASDDFNPGTFASPRFAALNGTDIATLDDTNEELRTYRFAHYIGTGPYRP